MATGTRVIIYYLSTRSRALADSLLPLLPEAEVMQYRSGAMDEALWQSARALIFLSATGIAVRTIAPLLKDKATDPAVLVMDEAGKHVVSLLGGHEAGGNELCRTIAKHTGAEAVITTATDSSGLSSIDEFARRHGMTIENRERLASTSAKHLEARKLRVYSDQATTLPEDYELTLDAEDADVLITPRLLKADALLLRPRVLVVGVGVNTGTKCQEIDSAVREALTRHGLSEASMKSLATHEKKLGEEGLVEYARMKGLRLFGYTTEELNAIANIEESPAARAALGVRAVSEPAALLGAQSTELAIKKQKLGNVTVAAALSATKGLVRVVGTGPGDQSHIIPEALAALRSSDVIMGYKPYLEQISSLISGKDVRASAMTEEVARAREAVELAARGLSVSMVSGGDPGVYAMAGLVLEVARAYPVEVEVVPGISALNACASRLGAPLMHDFAVLSLSDRLTPWDLIQQRVEAAALADFVIVLYNPKSRGRATHIDRVREIVLKHRAAWTPVGIVTAALRPTERIVLTTLGDMLQHEIGMQSTVFIGNSRTYKHRGRMITPRGYEGKYTL